MPLHFFLALLLTTLLPNLARTASLSSISTGTISVITTFSGMQVNTPITVTTTLGITPLAPATSTNVAVSIMSFQSLISIELIFNTTVLSLSPSSLQISFSPINATYFKKVDLHYMAAQHPYIQILRGCFYCGNTLTGDGYRHQHFYNFTYSFPTPATTPPASLPTALVLAPAISGIKISNSLGRYYQVAVSAATTSTTALDIHVQTDEYNLLQWVCVSIIAYWKFVLPNEVFLRASTAMLQGVVVGSYPTLTQNSNIMFFGISAFKFDLLLDQDLLFQLSTSTLTNPTQLTANNNLISVTLEQFFIWDPACTLIDTTIMACTLTCPSGTYAVGVYCVPCGTSATNCLTCDTSGCTSCDLTTPIFRTLVNQSCLCNDTYYESAGVCLLCNSSFPNCRLCHNASFCIQCYPPYNATPTGLCGCQAGLAPVLGVCKLLPGCVVMNNITSGAYCQQCSAALNFVLAADQTCVCVRNATYDNYTGKCKGSCVDGLALDNICDDGDLIETNGCMNNCTVTPGYHCTNPNKYAPSVCVPLRNFTVDYLYAVKDSSISIANLYFLISPDDPTLPQMDFSTLVQTTIPLSTLTASYHSIGNGSGYLLVSAGYTATIENTQQNMTFFFDNSLVWAPQVDLTIKPSGLNYQLSFNAADSFTSIIGMLGVVVGVGAVVIALASSVLGYKLIGFEIMLPVQIMYLAISELNHTYSALGQLRTLNYSNGYNQLVPYSMVSSSSAGLLVMQRSAEFLANVNISAVPLIVTAVVALTMRIGVREKKSQENTGELKKGKKGGKKLEIQPIDAAGKPTDPTAKPLDPKTPQKGENGEKELAQEDTAPPVPAPPIEPDKCQQAYLFVMDRILITLWVALIPNCLFSFAVQMQGLPTNSTQFPVGANIATGALFLLASMLCLMMLAGKVYDKENRITFHIKSRKYPVYLVSFYALQAAVIGSTYFKAPIAIYPALVLSTLPVLLQFRKQPHGGIFSLHALTAIYCQLLPGLTLTLLLLSSSLGEGTLASVLALSVLGAGLIGEGLSIVRLILHLREDYLRRKQAQSMAKAEKQDAELQSIAHETIKRSVPQGEPIFHWDGRDRDYKDGSGSQRKLRNEENSEMEEEQEENDEDELARIKMRLKKELINKRGNV